MKRAPWLWGLAWCLVTGPVLGADLGSLERNVQDEHARRERLLVERAEQAQQALSLADAITAAKRSARGARAAPDLEKLLRAFEKVADRLERIEADIGKANQRLQAAAGRFRDAAERELEAVGRGQLTEDQARDVSEIEKAGRRVDGMVEPRRPFRPPLVVVLEASDGLEDLELKVDLLLAEQTRLEEHSGVLEMEDRILAARVESKLRLGHELEVARRDARLDVRLVDRQADRLRTSLGQLRQEQRELAQRGREVHLGLEEIGVRLAEVEDRRATLLRGATASGQP